MTAVTVGNSAIIAENSGTNIQDLSITGLTGSNICVVACGSFRKGSNTTFTSATWDYGGSNPETMTVLKNVTNVGALEANVLAYILNPITNSGTATLRMLWQHSSGRVISAGCWFSNVGAVGTAQHSSTSSAVTSRTTPAITTKDADSILVGHGAKDQRNHGLTEDASSVRIRRAIVDSTNGMELVMAYLVGDGTAQDMTYSSSNAQEMYVDAVELEGVAAAAGGLVLPGLLRRSHMRHALTR